MVAGVAPHQVAQPSALRDLLEPVELLDLLERLAGGRDACMHREELLVDDGADGQFVKEFHDEFVDVLTVFGEA